MFNGRYVIIRHTVDLKNMKIHENTREFKVELCPVEPNTYATKWEKRENQIESTK